MEREKTLSVDWPDSDATLELEGGWSAVTKRVDGGAGTSSSHGSASEARR
jgi:hypothetical protein